SGNDPQWSSNYVERLVTVQNSLASAVARVLAYDAEGNEIYANIQVIDPNTKEIVAELGMDPYENVMRNTVKRSLFKNGQLTFAIYDSGCLYQLTTGFAQEIKLGVEAQETSLVFKNSAVTLAGASVYIGGPAGMVQLGTTDENGALNVTMMPGSYELYVADSKNGYFVHCTAVQDGDQLELAFADAISAAQPFKIDTVAKLSQYDYYSIGFSNVDTKNISKTAGLGWISSAVDTIHVTPGSYYMLVGIYDAYFSEGDEEQIDTHEYLETIHIMGMVDTATDQIDFDPAVLKAHLLLEPDYVLYGESLPLTFNLTNDKNKTVLSGQTLGYSQFGTFSDIDRWTENFDCDVFDTNEQQLWVVEADWSGGKFLTVGYEPLPPEEAIYNLALRYYFWDNRDGMVDFMSYETIEDTAQVLVKEGITLTVMPNLSGDDWAYVESVTTMVDGKEKALQMLMNEGDVVTYNANQLKKGDPLFIQVSTWSGDCGYKYYMLAEFDPENPTVTAVRPQTMGSFKLYFGEDVLDSASTTISTEYGDFAMNLPTSAYSTYYVPAGRYNIAGMCQAGYDEEFNRDRYLAYCADLYIDAGQMTEVNFNPANATKKPLFIERPEITYLDFKLVKGDTVISANPFDNWMPNDFVVAKAEGLDEVQIQYALLPNFTESWESDVMSDTGIEYTGVIDFVADTELVLGSIDITDFTVDLSDTAFTTQDDVMVPLQAVAADSILIRNMAVKYYEKRYLDSDHVNYDMVIVDKKVYLPEVEYRKAGGEWITATDVSWSGANLGKLAAGEYEIRFKLPEDPENGVIAWEAYAVFAVTGEDAPAEHHISIYAPATATEEITVTLMGNAGASVVVHYITPGGEEKTLEAVTLSDSGRATVSLALDAEGEYMLWAESTLQQGDATLTATSETIIVSCDQAIPNQVANFKVTAQGNNALLLTWDQVTDATKLWIYREGVQLGYLSTELCEYLDEDLSTDRTYTYYIIAENGAGTQGPAAYASARPTAVADTTAPTAPAQLQAEVKGTSVALNWTRSTDDVGVAFYRLCRNGEVIYEGTKRTFVDSGLQKGTMYIYDVQAVDASGNESAKTQPVAVTTSSYYELQDVAANIELNRLGDVTGNELELFANAGLDATRVCAEIAYTRKNATKAISNEQKTTTVELAKSGYYWRALWDISDVLSIQSVKISAYEGDTLMGSKEVEGFPMLVSSPAIVQLNIPNAPYAPNFLSGAKIVLTDTTNNLVYTKDLNINKESYEYEFTGLSAGTYSLKVMIGGESHYYERNIQLETGVGFYREINIEGLIRLKAKSGDVMYTINGKTMSVTNDGYLQLGNKDSAFWVKNSILLVRNVEEMARFGDKLYKIPENHRVTRVAGVYEYELPAYEDMEELHAFELKIMLVTPYSGVALDGMPIHVIGQNEKGQVYSKTLLTGNDRTVTTTWPMEYAKSITATQEAIYWTDAYGKKANFSGVSRVFENFAVDGSETLRLTLPEKVEREVEVQLFGINYPYGLTGWVKAAGSTYYTLEFDENGYAKTTVLWDYATNAATIGIKHGTCQGDIIKAQTFGISSPGWHAIVPKTESKVTQVVPVRIKEEHGLYIQEADLRVDSNYGSDYLKLHGNSTYVTFYSEENKLGYYENGNYGEEWLYGEAGAGASFYLNFETDIHIFSGYIGSSGRPGFSLREPDSSDYYHKEWDPEGEYWNDVFNAEAFAADMDRYRQAQREYDAAVSNWKNRLYKEGFTFSADLKLNFTNLAKNMGYIVLYYDNAATGAPFKWYTGLSEKYPSIQFYGPDYPKLGMTIVVVPLQSYLITGRVNGTFDIQRFTDMSLSAWKDYEGVDIFAVNDFGNIQPTYKLTTPKILKLGVMTDLAGNDITGKVSATRYLAGRLLYQETVRDLSEVVLYDYDGEELLLIPETVVGPDRIQEYKAHHDAHGDVLCVVANLDSTITAPINKQ
ncbi:MAG: hypothetical protein J6Q53_00345, partial [Oscillospiraceae bacterium]|nr:hypothetical protein [Oscillospiraceae bacterium]